MKRSILLMFLLVIYIACMCIGAPAETVKGDPTMRLDQDIVEYNGVNYRLKRRITPILVLGVDQWTGDISDDNLFRSGGQADFQLIVVIDDNEKAIYSIIVNRDTMAEITILNMFGQPIGNQVAQICLAYSYGDGGITSCQLAVEAFSKYLKNVPVDHFFAMNLDGISILNDYLGGIEVTLMDDFTMYDSCMRSGATLTLKGKQAEYFLRNRYSIGDGSNTSRMHRQTQYIDAVKDELAIRMNQSSTFILDLFDILNDYATTDMNRGLIVNIANKANKYTICPSFEIEGTSILNEAGYVEFYSDDISLMEVVLAVFYEPI